LFRAEAHAVHDGHHHIEQDERRPWGSVFAQFVEGLDAIGGQLDAITMRFE
jgi:hypothetical protein